MKSLLLACAALAPACVVGDEPVPGGPITADSVHGSVRRLATLSYAPNSFVIGNAFPGWTDIIQGPAQFSSGPGNPNGASYRWGYLYGEEFDRCAWIDDGSVDPTTSHHGANDCGTPQQIDTAMFLATYTNGEHNQLAGDGSITYMQYDGSGCTDREAYANVAPWRVPATPANRLGEIPNGRELRWRYVTRDGHWVLVRDSAAATGEPNWYFVHRGCVSVANLY